MATKKQRRTDEVKTKKTKKKRRLLLLSFMMVAAVVFLAIFFITLFDYIYPPRGSQHAGAKKKDKKEVTLFFSDANERFLIPEKRFVLKEKELEAQGLELVKALLAGSKTGLVQTFPGKAELQDVKLEGIDTLVVNFRESLVANHPGGSAAEMATVYSLTQTISTNIPEIKKVRILIGGSKRDSLKGHIGLENPLTPNPELIAPAAPPKEG